MIRRQNNRRKALLDITNNNELDESIKKLGRMSKRKASKNAILKIVKALSTSGNTSSVEEKVVKKRKKTKKDVYEFTFDSDEEDANGQKKKSKRQCTASTNSNDVTWQYFETKKDTKKRKVIPAVKAKKTVRTQRKRNINKSTKPMKKTEISAEHKKLIRDCSVQIDNKDIVDEHYKNKLKQEDKKKSAISNTKNQQTKSVKNPLEIEKKSAVSNTKNPQNKSIKNPEDKSIKNPQNKSINTNKNTEVIKKTDVTKNIDKPTKTNDPVVIEDTFDDYDNFHDPLPSPLASTFINISDTDVSVHHKTLQDEICDSFMEGLDENPGNNSINNLIMNSIDNLKDKLTPNKNKSINVISNVVLRKPRSNKIFNSTMNPNLDISNPWRLNVSNIKNPHTFTVKEKSFVPNYDQEIVMNSTLAEKLSPIKNKPGKIEKNMQQTSILNFVGSTKEHKIDVPVRAGGLFESPRKILGEINYQSTPLNTRRKILSPNISVVKSPDKSDENKENTLFGFSCSDESVTEKMKTPKKRSPRKEKAKTVLFNDEVEVKEKTEEFEIPSSADISALFKDVENDKLEVKKTRRSYERLRPKRKRLPSVHSEEEENESDHDDEVIQFRLKQKVTSKASRKEEEEIDKLASHYNSMFDEIDKFDLCID